MTLSEVDSEHGENQLLELEENVSLLLRVNRINGHSLKLMMGADLILRFNSIKKCGSALRFLKGMIGKSVGILVDDKGTPHIRSVEQRWISDDSGYLGRKFEACHAKPNARPREEKWL
jgi:hypothetical protein